jgi:hypothetical protein
MRAPKKITALPTVITIKNADWFALVQDGVTSKVTFDDLNKATGDEWITGGTYNAATGCATFNSNSAHTFVVCGFLTGYTDAYTTGATLNGTVIEFGSSLFGNNYYSVDIGDLRFSGGTGSCITNLYVTNIHGCSPITIHDNLQHISSTASGPLSIAWGSGTTAMGAASHAEGLNTKASGDLSHAEGNTTIASGGNAHAEGGGTIASGLNSHAEGQRTYASGSHSHAGGRGFGNTGTVPPDAHIYASGNTSFIHYHKTNPPAMVQYMGAFGDYSAILGGSDHHIFPGGTSSGIFAGSGNTISPGIEKSVVLGGDNITAVESETAYVPQLNIGTVGSGTSVNNLGIDSGGNVVAGTSGGGTFNWCDPVVMSGNTSGCCIDTLWVSTISGCSPVTIGKSITTISSTVEGISSIAYGQNTLVEADNSNILGGVSNQIKAPSTYNSDNYTLSFSASNTNTITISYTASAPLSALQVEFINDYGDPILPTITGVTDETGGILSTVAFSDISALIVSFTGNQLLAGSGTIMSVGFDGPITSFFSPLGDGKVLSKARIGGDNTVIFTGGTGNGGDINGDTTYNVLDVVAMINGLLTNNNLNGVSALAWNYCIPATSAGNMSGNDGVENVVGLIQNILALIPGFALPGPPPIDSYCGFENIYGGTGNSNILGGEDNTINTVNASIIGGKDNIVDGPSGSIIGSTRSYLSGNRSVILGGDSISGSNHDTVYVPTLNISTLCAASGVTSFNNLLIDEKGYVVVGDSQKEWSWCDPVVRSGNTSGCCINTVWTHAVSGCSDLYIGTDGDIYLQTIPGPASGHTSVYINELGQVGIGTTEPFAWVTPSPMTGKGIEIHNDDSNNKIPLALTELGVQRWYIETDFANPNNPVQIKGSSDINLMTWFTSSSTPRLGVGTTDPQGTLHLSRNGGVADQTKYPDETNIVVNNTSAGWTGSTSETPNKSSFRFDHTQTERSGGLIASVRTPEWDSFGPGSGSTTLEIWNASEDTLYKRIEIEPDGTTTISGNTVIGGNLNIGNVLTTPSSYNLGIDSNGFVTSGTTFSWSDPVVKSGNTSGSCIIDLFVSNIHPCSPLNIIPNSEDNLFIGSGFTFDLTTNVDQRLGINTASPEANLHIKGLTPPLFDNLFLIEDSAGNVVMGANDEGALAIGVDPHDIAMSGESSLFIKGDSNTTTGPFDDENIALRVVNSSNNNILLVKNGDGVTGDGTVAINGTWNGGPYSDTASLCVYGSQSGSGATLNTLLLADANTNTIGSIGADSRFRFAPTLEWGMLKVGNSFYDKEDGKVHISPTTRPLGGNEWPTISNNMLRIDGFENTGAPWTGYTSNIFVVDNFGNVNVKKRTTTENFTMTSGPTAGYVLTSDVSGNASWQPASGTTYWEEGSGLKDTLGGHTISSGTTTDFSIIAGGENSKILGDSTNTKWNAIVGGANHQIWGGFTSSYNAILGGDTNQIGGLGAQHDGCTIIGGDNNLITGICDNTVIIGMTGATVAGVSNTVFMQGINIGTTGIPTTQFRLADGTQQNGYVLTSDGSGNASWQVGGGGTPFSWSDPVVKSGNTSGDCIDILWVSIISGCSPVTIGDSVQSQGCSASGENSQAWGKNTEATGTTAHAEGEETKAYGENSHAEGKTSRAIGNQSHAEGNNTLASNTAAHAEGGWDGEGGAVGTTASGLSSHAEGAGTTAEGDYSHAEGKGSMASGSQSHAEGGSTASGSAAHAEGDGTTASGDRSHAQGYNTVAMGLQSHSAGARTIASGGASFASGDGGGPEYEIVASGKTSFVHYSKSLPIGGRIGAWSDYSTILGGVDHNIVEGNDNSIILGGDSNEIVGPNSENTFIIGGDSNTLNITSGTMNSGIVGGLENFIGDTPYGGRAHQSVIVGGQKNEVTGIIKDCFIGGGSGNTIDDKNRSVILGGQGITATEDDTVYVPNLEVRGDLNLCSGGTLYVSSISGCSPVVIGGEVEITGPLRVDGALTVDGTSVGGSPYTTKAGGAVIDWDYSTDGPNIKVILSGGVANQLTVDSISSFPNGTSGFIIIDPTSTTTYKLPDEDYDSGAGIKSYISNADPALGGSNPVRLQYTYDGTTFWFDKFTNMVNPIYPPSVEFDTTNLIAFYHPESFNQSVSGPVTINETVPNIASSAIIGDLEIMSNVSDFNYVVRNDGTSTPAYWEMGNDLNIITNPVTLTSIPSDVSVSMYIHAKSGGFATVGDSALFDFYDGTGDYQETFYIDSSRVFYSWDPGHTFGYPSLQDYSGNPGGVNFEDEWIFISYGINDTSNELTLYVGCQSSLDAAVAASGATNWDYDGLGTLLPVDEYGLYKETASVTITEASFDQFIIGQNADGVTVPEGARCQIGMVGVFGVVLGDAQVVANWVGSRSTYYIT